MARKLEMAFNEAVAGVFTLASALDGPDVLSDLGGFAGTYDDISADLVGEITVNRGSDSLAGRVQPSSLTATVSRPDAPGYWNANNPLSPLNSVSPGFVPIRPGRLTDIGDGPGGQFLTSGFEITDASRAVGVDGDGRLNDGSFGIYEQRQNLCPNGGVETSTAGWDPYGSGATLAQYAADFKFGSKCLRATTPGGFNCVFNGPSPAVVAGSTYTLSMWIRAATGGGTEYLRILWNAGVATEVLVTANAAGWQRVSVTGVAPVGATAAALGLIYYNGSAQDWLIDGVMFNAGPVALPYCEGTIPAGRLQGPAPLLGSATQFAIAMRVRIPYASSAQPNPNPGLFELADNTGNFIAAYLTSTDIQLARKSTAAGQYTCVKAVTFAANDLATIILKGTDTQLGVSVNGSPFTTLVTPAGSAPTIAASLFDIARLVTGFVGFPGDLDALWAATLTGIPTNADAAWIHTELVAGREPMPADINDRSPAAVCTGASPFNTAAYTIPNVKYGVFYGFLRRAPWRASTRSCQLYFEDLLFRASRVFPVIASTGPTTTGAAIGLVLDAMGWTWPEWRSLARGDTLDDFRADGSQSALQLFGLLVTAERGTVFVRGDGVFVYESRDMPQTRVPVGILSTVVNLEDLESSIDADSILTRVTVTKTDPVTPIVRGQVDALAEQRFGRGDAPSISSPYVPANGVQLLADDIVYQGVNGKPPATAEVFAVDNATTSLILGSALQTVFTIVDPLGGTTGDYLVAGATHTLDTGSHRVSYTLTKRAARSFALDSALNGPDVFRY
jgi:hypothetical protein